MTDEYDYGGSTVYTGPEPSAPNVSIYAAAEMTSRQTKWHRWLPEANVDTYEGAMYYPYGIYRPTSSSKMRSLGRPFEQVNAEQFVFSVYRTVQPIDAATPPGTYPQGTVFYVDPVDPVGHALDVQWSLDGTPIPGAAGTTFDSNTLTLTSGTHTLSVQVVDNTPLVRDEALRAQLMARELTWTVIPATLAVTEFTATSTGFTARFCRDLEPSVLNLYDSASQPLGAADVTVTGAAQGAVRGSLVVGADQRQITFVKTGGLLEPDTYTVTLFSGAARFREPSGGLLDGNADGTTGDDYQTTFTVAARPAGTVTVSLPDLARGAGQTVNV
ncbi:MAG: hypothetical protein JW741_29225, partial [Sedimentisphaerales bacterium]|nr:hypothetical protein [Sedimentisphaerales bacterium]